MIIEVIKIIKNTENSQSIEIYDKLILGKNRIYLLKLKQLKNNELEPSDYLLID